MKRATVSPAALLREAAAALRQAHAPYSHYAVGAALLGVDGRVYRGCNVENGSYGLTLCAERVAVGNAVAAGCRRFKALAIVAKGKGRLAGTRPVPCGACRQVFAEFCADSLPVHVAAAGQLKAAQHFTLGQLLPERFKLA